MPARFTQLIQSISGYLDILHGGGNLTPADGRRLARLQQEERLEELHICHERAELGRHQLFASAAQESASIVDMATEGAVAPNNSPALPQNQRLR